LMGLNAHAGVPEYLIPVSGLHGGRSALGVGTRWAACACSLRV
jgi:hypothetical protein